MRCINTYLYIVIKETWFIRSIYQFNYFLTGRWRWGSFASMNQAINNNNNEGVLIHIYLGLIVNVRYP